MSGSNPHRAPVRSAGASARPKPGSQLFYEEAYEKENAYRRKVGMGPSNNDIEAIIASRHTRDKGPRLEDLPPPTPLKRDGTPDCMAQLSRQANISGYWPRLQGRDAHSLTTFYYGSPLDVTAAGKLKMPENLQKANTQQKVEYMSASQRNFSMGQTPHYTNEARAREALDYLDAFNSPICASNIEHRTHYGEFSKFVHENGRSYFLESDTKC